MIKMKDDAPKAKVNISICDTEVYSYRESFSAFREAIANAFMPWVFERPTPGSFSARLESFTVESGSFGRTRMSPLVGSRDRNEISRSREECLYANFVLAGELHVEQGDRVSSAKPGDLIVYDSAIPLEHIKIGDRLFEDLAFSIPKARLNASGQKFANTLVSANEIMPPLAKCIAHLCQPLTSLPADELDAVASACATLLPRAIGWAGGDKLEAANFYPPNRYERELLKFIEDQLANPDLSPRMAAEHFGISVRYIHKRFAMQGTTFGNYVRTKRLNRIRRDIHSLPHSQPIAMLAYRWGFNDFSTFLRAFKREFGCTPGQYRSKY